MAAVRAEELAAAPFLQTVLQELEHEQRFLPIEVVPLTRADNKRLVQALVQSSTGVDSALLVEPIWAISEGNPLVVVETVLGLQTAPAPPSADPLPVPPRIREIILRQLASLDAPAQETLATAAAIGREFDFGLLRAACRCRPQKLAATLDDLLRRRILAGTDDAFYFTHARVREVVYGGLSSQRRKVLAAAVARGRAYFLEERPGWSR
jgi:predicted ATPase